MHIHIDVCICSFDKWPLDIVRTKRTHSFLFVAQFRAIDILSGVPVSSNSVVITVSQRVSERRDKKSRIEMKKVCNSIYSSLPLRFSMYMHWHIK